MLPDIKQLHELLQRAAQRDLLPRFNACEAYLKADRSVITEADFALQEYLREELAHAWPDYDFLGEEMPAQEQSQRLQTSRAGLWCVDPLDGTNNFAAGIPFFTISLALLIEGEAVLGLVYDPLREECFMAQRGQGAWMNGTRLHPVEHNTTLSHSIAVVDFKRLDPQLAGRLAQRQPYRSQRNFGSVALEWAWLAAGRVHVYLHGGQNLWDYAAGHLILTEAGGQAATLNDRVFFHNGLQPCSVVAALEPLLFQAWKDWVSAA